MPLQSIKAKRKRGEHKRGSTVPTVRMRFARLETHIGVLRRERGAIANSFSVLHFARRHRAALYAARVIAPVGVSVTIADQRGVSDPHLAAPFFAPPRARRGSLTPHLRVSLVRSNCMQSMSVGDRAPRVGSRTGSISRGCQVSPGTCVH